METERTSIRVLYNSNEAQFQILEGTDGQQFLDIRTLYPQLGMYTFDPGYTMTASCQSEITHTGDTSSELLHRGYRIQELADNCSFLEVCYLIIYGELPDDEEKERFENLVKSQMLVHSKLLDTYHSFQQGAHPMAIMVGIVGALSAFMHSNINVTDAQSRELAIIQIIAKLPMLAAAAYRTAVGLPIVYPKHKYGFVENFVYMMFADPMDPDYAVDPNVVKTMELIFVLHADHEQNASTSTVRIAGSSEANPYACVAAGIASLWGPQHGGANEVILEMLENIEDVSMINHYIARSKDPNDKYRLMGFGHRVYKSHDPRSTILKEKAPQIISNTQEFQRHQRLFDIAVEVERAALNDPYFQQRNLFPNVDFYSGIVLSAIGIPKDMFNVIFSVSRAVGWMAQWNEMMSDPSRKIGRPRQLYTGHHPRAFVKLEQRSQLVISLQLLNMHRAIPVGNKLLSKRWEEYNHSMHKKRVRKMRSVIDRSKPSKFTHLKYKAKKEQMLEDRYTEIERENRILLEKMSYIMNKSPTRAQSQKHRYKRSLNRDSRKKQLERITVENQALLRRLQDKKPSFTFTQLERDRKQAERRLQNICEYPYQLGNDSSVKRNVSSENRSPLMSTENSFMKKKQPRKLDPIKGNGKILFKQGKSIGHHYYMMELHKLKNYFQILAFDVESPDSFNFRLEKALVDQILNGGRNYKLLFELIDYQNGKLIIDSQKGLQQKFDSPSQSYQLSDIQNNTQIDRHNNKTPSYEGSLEISLANQNQESKQNLTEPADIVDNSFDSIEEAKEQSEESPVQQNPQNQ